MYAATESPPHNDPTSCADWPFIQNGAVTLFRSEKVLEQAIDTLKNEGYHVARIDLGNVGKIVAGFSKALRWKEQFGYEPETLNLNALADAFSGVPNSITPKLLLVFTRYSGLKKADNTLAFDLFDIIANASREHLIFGHRLLAFVRTGNPRETISGIGASHAQWNPKEWMMTSRGL